MEKLKILLFLFVFIKTCESDQNKYEYKTYGNDNMSHESVVIEKFDDSHNVSDNLAQQFYAIEETTEEVIENTEETETTDSTETDPTTDEIETTTEVDTTTTTTEEPKIVAMNDEKETTADPNANKNSTFAITSIANTTFRMTTTTSTTTATTSTTTAFTTLITTTSKPVCELETSNHSLSEDNFLTVNWTVNDELLCATYKIRFVLNNKNCHDSCINKAVNDCNLECMYSEENIQANILSYKLEKELKPCVKYNYTIILTGNLNVTQDKSEDEIVANKKYQSVENLSSNVIEDVTTVGRLNTLITWTYEYAECIPIFQIIITGIDQEFEERLETEDFNVTVTTLPACMNFTIKVYPDRENTSASIIELATQFVTPSDIKNLTHVEDGTSINLSWIRPKYGAYCIKYYEIFAESEHHVVNDTIAKNQTSYQLKDSYACVSYAFALKIVSIDDEIEVTTEMTSTTTTTTVETTTSQPSTEAVSQTIRSSTRRGTDITPLLSPEFFSLRMTTLPRKFDRPKHPSRVAFTDTTLTLSTTLERTRNMCQIIKYSFSYRSQNQNQTKLKESDNDTVVIEGLDAYTLYNCTAKIMNINEEWSDDSYSEALMTDEGTPNAPKFYIDASSTTTRSFTVKWEEPTEPKGRITHFTVSINFINYNYYNPSYCTLSGRGENINLSADDETSIYSHEFTTGLPFSNYSVQVQAHNSKNPSKFSEPSIVITKGEKSDVVRTFEYVQNEVTIDEDYNKRTLIKWSYPCQAHGRVEGFKIKFTSNDSEEEDEIPFFPNQSNYTYETTNFQPDIIYKISVAAYSEHDEGRWSEISYQLKPGIPEATMVDSVPWVKEATTTSILLFIPDTIFQSNVGRINEIVFLLAELNCGNSEPERKRGYLIDDNSSNVTYKDAMNENCVPQYHSDIKLTKDTTRDPDGIMESHIGVGVCESAGRCNGPLKSGTVYALTFRFYTQTGFADSIYMKIQTDRGVPIVIILISVLSILCVVFLIGFYISCRRTRALRKSALDSPYDRKDIAVQNFPAYYKEMISNESEKIKDEYKAIQFFSENLDKTVIASKTNEKLNRYANISPYDANRVVLNEDEFENDYINASYINGYYHSKEYIAAQGPKPITSFDFWRMVLQHRVESIVMLTSLVENNKVKCHEYFPKLNGHVKFDNIRIVCIDEQKHSNYIKRLLEVEKDDMKIKVKHYFYLKWPDHSSPNNPTELIDFIKVVRNERQKLSESFIVHCSAGVGRTGTFISVDIMMQRIKKEGKINIFDLVKQLRFQRMKMVQTIDQYSFIYACALELSTTRPKPSRVLQNLAIYIEEFELLKKWKNRTKDKNENILKADENDKESSM